jgi:hypothetical protein
MPINAAGHRVIGIRHTLKRFKSAGLVEEESLYPQQGVDDVQHQVLSAAQTWYQVGAKRGAIEVLEAFLNGEFEVRTNKKGQREIIATAKAVTWKRGLNVTVGNEKHHVARRSYKLTLKDLEFDK